VPSPQNLLLAISITQFANVRQNSMIMRLNLYNIDTFQKLITEKDVRRFPNIFLDVHQVYSVFPLEWKTLIRNTGRTHQPINDQVNVGLNKWIAKENITLKLLTSVLTEGQKNLEIVQYLGNRHQGADVNQIQINPFMSLKNVKDVKVRNLQYKMLHNIYPTMAHLKKWKIKDNENCGSCDVKETLIHAIYDCAVARVAINHLENEIRNRYLLDRVNLTLTSADMIFGISSTKSIDILKKEQLRAIDIVIIELKQKLILQRENKHELTREDVKNLFVERYRLGCYTSKKGKEYCRFKKGMGYFMTLLLIHDFHGLSSHVVDIFDLKM